MSKMGQHYIEELERKYQPETLVTPDTICVDCGLRYADHLNPLECPICPLCGKPSPVGETHDACMEERLEQ